MTIFYGGSFERGATRGVYVIIFLVMVKPHEENGDGAVAVEESRPKLKEPPQYAVVLLNDDYTTMEFVVEVLQRFFHKTTEQAVEIMLRVHQEGRGVAGIYTYEIAETKVAQVHEHAKSAGFPLKCILEKV